MNSTKGVEIKLSYKEGLFQTNQRIMLYVDHVTELELADVLKAAKALLTKAIKSSTDNPWVEVDFMDDSYRNYHQTRVILNRYMWDNSWEMDYRKYNGIDFSDKKAMHFATSTAMIKFAVQDIERLVRSQFTNIPEERSLYIQLQDESQNVQNAL